MLHEFGLGYRKIANFLNNKGVRTHRGKEWRGGNIYSVLKRHREREVRLKFVNKEYEPKWGKMEVMWENNLISNLRITYCF